MIHPRTASRFAGLRIGLLGGSFNPAHQGHRMMSLHALKRLNLDQVWWLVSPQNPLKPVAGMGAYAERLRQARMTARHPRIVVTDIEEQLGTRFTIDTLHTLQKRFPRTRFVWLMGADNWQQLPRWKRWREIFDAAPIAIFSRPGYRREGIAAQHFTAARHGMHAARKLADMKPPAWLVLDNQLNYLSSTAIRKLRGL